MKKHFVLSLLAVFLIGMALPQKAEAFFSDVRSNYWAAEEIMKLYDANVIGGYPDGTFRPNQPVTRIQAAAMIVQALDLERQSNQPPSFKDISADHTNIETVAIMEETGIIKGSNGHFRPYENLTRGQMAAILVRTFELDTAVSDAHFQDIQADHWAYTYINTIAKNQIASGYEDGTFRAYNDTTRAQFSVFLVNALKTKQPKDIDESLLGKVGPVIVEGDYAYSIEDRQLVRRHVVSGERETLLTREDIQGDLFVNPPSDYYAQWDGRGFIDETSLMIHNNTLYYLVEYSFHTGGAVEYPEYHLYQANLDGTNRDLVYGESMKTVVHPYLIDKHVYFIDHYNLYRDTTMEHKLLRVNVDTGEVQTIKELNELPYRSNGHRRGESQPYLFDYYGVYAYYIEDNQLIRLHLESLRSQPVYQGEVDDFFFEDNQLVIAK
uniref:S-layer homology domain-containing protein n=1 Tax=Halalkalibacterium ligniniphilum TaxID=1134413 RepID=UPI00191C5DE8